VIPCFTEGLVVIKKGHEGKIKRHYKKKFNTQGESQKKKRCRERNILGKEGKCGKSRRRGDMRGGQKTVGNYSTCLGNI